jgi:dipeptidyl aminopeptidase/acylaminoacyl peptidase
LYLKVFLALLSLAAVPALADTTLTAPSVKPLLDDETAKSWRALSGLRLTPDGRFLVYSVGLNSNRLEHAELVIRALGSGAEQRFPLSAQVRAADSLILSPSGRWVGFLEDFGGRARVSIVEVASGRRTDFGAAQAFEFASGTSEKILLKVSSSSGNDLEVVELRRPTEREAVLRGVTAHILSADGRRLAWIDEVGANVMDLVQGWRRSLGPVGKDLALSWSPDGKSLAVVQIAASPAKIITFTHVSRSGAQRTEVVVPSASPPFTWRTDGRGLFFNVRRERGLAPPPAPPAPIVWNTAARWLPGDTGAPETDWHFMSLRTGKVFALEEDRIRLVDILPSERTLLAADLEFYGGANVDKDSGRMASPYRADYYVIDADSGARKLLLRDLRVVSRLATSVKPRLSPDHTDLLYQNASGAYVARDVRTGSERNLTQGVSASFRIPGNDPPSGWQPLKGGAEGAPDVWNGWTVDGAYALVADPFDIWALPVKKGGRPLNLTGDGREKNVWYQVARFSSGYRLGYGADLENPDLARPLWFYRFDSSTGIKTLMRRDPGTTTLQEVYSEYAEFRYVKASRAPVYAMLHAGSVDSPDAYAVDAQMQRSVRLTDTNPQQRRFEWSPPAKMLMYKNSRGESRRAIVHLPVGYREGQRYPAIVKIYESVETPHEYHVPGSFFDPTEMFLRNGYVYLLPDIQPRMGDAGPAALDDVESGVRAAIAAGFVDEKSVGLSGHSFGGYEALYIATRSRLFKAIVAFAGVANTVSDCGSIVFEGHYRPSICEYDQPYAGSMWWDAPDVFARNNPILRANEISTPLLLSHGDADVHVFFSQSAEMFNALRRLRKPAVLLQYRGEGHEYREAAARDFYQRMLEFFGHFLKGRAVPEWWQAAMPPNAATKPPQ